MDKRTRPRRYIDVIIAELLSLKDKPLDVGRCIKLYTEIVLYSLARAPNELRLGSGERRKWSEGDLELMMTVVHEAIKIIDGVENVHKRAYNRHGGVV